jgi:hypothetical protein
MLATKTTVLQKYPSSFPSAWTSLPLISLSCESEGPPVYITAPMTPIFTSTLKMEAACSPETYATQIISTWYQHARTQLVLTMNHHESHDSIN